jgi:hypothetical protein
MHLQTTNIVFSFSESRTSSTRSRSKRCPPSKHSSSPSSPRKPSNLPKQRRRRWRSCSIPHSTGPSSPHPSTRCHWHIIQNCRQDPRFWPQHRRCSRSTHPSSSSIQLPTLCCTRNHSRPCCRRSSCICNGFYSIFYSKAW